MNVLAIVPARAGSRGLPGKNVRSCGGQPLLVWSIAAARAACGVDRVVVSTDSHEYARIAEKAGAEIVMRPPELATDEATTDAVLVHVVDAYASNGYAPHLVVTLQPTVPVRPLGLIDEAITRLIDTEADSLLTVRRLHFVWWREETREYTDKTSRDTPYWRSQCPRRPRRQDMHGRELMFEEDGSVYVTRAEVLLGTGARLAGRVEVLETPRTVDIDTEDDLLLADALLRARLGKGEAVAC